MFSFFNNSEYLKRDFPCHLIETSQLEVFLESRAEMGELFTAFSRFGLAGYFEERMPKKYHYCIDVYYRSLKEDELKEAEFEEYKETCLACGWTYVSAFKNIVVFYSEAENRPQELQTDSALKRNILKQITLKMELRQMIVRLLLVLPLLSIYIPTLVQRWSEAWILDKNWWDITAFFPLVLLILVIIGGSIRNLRLIILVHKEMPIPHRGFWVNKFFIVQLFFSLWSCIIVFTCFWFRFYFQGLWAILALLFLLGMFFYGFRVSNKQGKDYGRWLYELPSAFKITGGSIVVLLLCVSFAYAPISDSAYRFSIQCMAEEYAMKYSKSWEREEIFTSALSQEDAALSTISAGGSFKENPGHYTDFEQVIYIWESYPEGVEHIKEKWFYVGTLLSSLSDEAKLDAYLKEKHLTLEGAEKYDLVQGVDSFFLPSGKEIVHVSGNLVVIHFLDKRDEKSFSLQNPEVRKAVAGKTEKILEMYCR